MQACENTFIWCIWRTCYLPPQLREVLVHQIYFYLVFTCLWVGTNERDTPSYPVVVRTRSSQPVSWHVSVNQDTTQCHWYMWLHTHLSCCVRHRKRRDINTSATRTRLRAEPRQAKVHYKPTITRLDRREGDSIKTLNDRSSPRLKPKVD